MVDAAEKATQAHSCRLQNHTCSYISSVNMEDYVGTSISCVVDTNEAACVFWPCKCTCTHLHASRSNSPVDNSAFLAPSQNGLPS